MFAVVVFLVGFAACGFMSKRGKAQKMSKKASHARKVAQTHVDDTKYKLRTEQEEAAHRVYLRNRTQEMLNQYREEAAKRGEGNGE